MLALIVGADPRRPDVPPIPLDASSGKALPDLKIAWSNQWQEVPVSHETHAAMQTVRQLLEQAGAKVDRWLPPDFDLPMILNLYSRMAAYVNNYAQPKDRYNIRRSLTLLFLLPLPLPSPIVLLGVRSRLMVEPTRMEWQMEPTPCPST